jgi:oxygen-independent coproporphyrinogen-3 oxidase
VPWTSRVQRLFDENDLPSAEEKLNLYIEGKKSFVDDGYKDIGMDHFALQSDDLYKAWVDGSLHRNFMGYTTQKTSLLLGLGVSSISDAGIALAQNKKALHEYYESIGKNELAIFRGYFLNEEDVSFRKYILDISCRGSTNFRQKDLPLLEKFSFPELDKLQADGLAEWDRKEVVVTTLGLHFIRNICCAFDLHLLRNQQKDLPRFSKAI